MKSEYTVRNFGGKLVSELKKLGVELFVETRKSNDQKSDLIADLFSKPEKSEKLEQKKKSTSPHCLLSNDGEKLIWNCENSHPVSAHGFIRDWKLGTIGLIHFLENEEPDEVRALLEEAAYLRHLLYEINEVGVAPIAIEVTLVVLNEGKIVGNVGKALREISETSTFLHTIGVSLLRAGDYGKIDALRRAFPWLLHATRKWLESSPKTSDEKTKKLESLVLENFRVDGKRDWKFDADQKMHLVHGPNGSGKSSLVEALEYLMTGQVDRLEKDHLLSPEEPGLRMKRYREVLTHRSADGVERVLRVEAKFIDGEPMILDLKRDQLLSPGMPAGGFKLDQRFSNDLIFGDQAQRAKLFLKHFFPEERERIEEYRWAKKELSVWWELAPETMKAIYEKAEEIQLDPQRSRSEVPIDYLPQEMRNPESRAILAFLLGKEGGQGEENLDTAWTNLRKKLPSMEKRMNRLSDILSKLNNWETRGANVKSSKKGAGEDLLNAWLHQVALTDLLEKEYDVTRTLADLDDKEMLRGAPFVRPNERTLERAHRLWDALDEAKTKRDQLQQELITQEHRKKGGKVSKRIELVREDYEALDWAAEYFQYEALEGPKLSTVLRDSLAKRKPFRVRIGKDLQVVVGEQVGSLKEWITKAGEISKCLATLQGKRRLFVITPSEMHDNLDNLEKILAEVKKQDLGLIEKFTEKVSGELTDATNELMALMTPARWAYEDIAIRSRLSDEEQGVSFESGEMAAAIKLNTAELNTMTLALFLLTAIGRTSNPLATIVMDDPFENMDELTTITVARCFARLQRLCRQIPVIENWQTILLLHGAENFERVRDEVPCAAYFLPWLAPDGQKGEGKIEKVPSRVSEEKMLANFEVDKTVRAGESL